MEPTLQPDGQPSNVDHVEPKDNKEKQLVSYETYDKAMNGLVKQKNENKLLSEKIAAYEAKEKEEQQKVLEAKGEYQKILEAERKENKVLKEKNAAIQNALINDKKFSKFQEKLGGKLAAEDYKIFVKLDDIAVDPDTGTIDEQSVESVVADFKTKHAKLIDSGKAPHVAGKGTGEVIDGHLTYESWLKLPGEQRIKTKGLIMKSELRK